MDDFTCLPVPVHLPRNLETVDITDNKIGEGKEPHTDEQFEQGNDDVASSASEDRGHKSENAENGGGGGTKRSVAEALSARALDLGECFEAFGDVDDLQGDNAYFCENCGKRTHAKQHLSLHTFPR